MDRENASRKLAILEVVDAGNLWTLEVLMLRAADARGFDAEIKRYSHPVLFLNW